ncbi:MAG TPA: DNA polymerase IV [Actinomycetota bacterium]|nr:DNA polymerase IV [Actinomycetota bacterium]
MATRWILHVDLDQFIAAVEMLRRPELAGRPVVVGGDGDPTKRGVVSTANYEARRFGIRSGMALRTAYKRCPEAMFLPVDADTYLAASRRVMDALRTFPAVVQVLGWDEAFMAVEVAEPEPLAREVQGAVLDRTDLWCSIGVGDNTLRAKIATGMAKPRGVFRLTEANWDEVMGDRPTVELFGVGKKTALKLAELGIITVRELATADERRLAERFGPKTGPWLRAVGNGEGGTEITDQPYVARGRGKERTFQRDLTDPEEARRRTVELARELASELRDGGRRVVRVIVKVRFAPFFTSTHGVTLPEPTLEPAAIERAALEALQRFELDRPVRLLGVRAELAEPDPGPRTRPWT